MVSSRPNLIPARVRRKAEALVKRGFRLFGRQCQRLAEDLRQFRECRLPR